MNRWTSWDGKRSGAMIETHCTDCGRMMMVRDVDEKSRVAEGRPLLDTACYDARIRAAVPDYDRELADGSFWNRFELQEGD